MFDFRAWLRKTFTPILGVSTVAALMSGRACAGNIVLTGHDDDFHDRFDGPSLVGSQPGIQLAQMLSFARGGAPNSALPVLIFDQGGLEMQTSVNGILGAANEVTIQPTAPLTAAQVASIDVKNYSAIVIASAQSCGGCDMTVGAYNNIYTPAGVTAIQNFINAGGGIVQMTGGTSASSRAAAYAYLPKTAGVAAGFPPSTGYVQTAQGAAIPIDAVNGDATHNLFNAPGTGGTSPAYVEFETLGVGGAPVTIGILGAKVGATTIVSSTPEPATIGLAVMGLAGLAGYGIRNRRKRNA